MRGLVLLTRPGPCTDPAPRVEFDRMAGWSVAFFSHEDGLFCGKGDAGNRRADWGCGHRDAVLFHDAGPRHFTGRSSGALFQLLYDSDEPAGDCGISGAAA